MIVINLALIDDESDKELFEKLFKMYKYKVYSITFHILKKVDTAEDAASEVFLYIAKNFAKIKSLNSNNLDRYIMIASRNIAIDVHRREKKHSQVQELSDEVLSDESLRAYDSVLLKSVIRSLSYEDQEILYLRYTLDMDHKLIAKSLGISGGAARNRLYLATKNLKAKLTEGDVS